MVNKRVHYKGCPNIDKGLCSYRSVRVICPNQGDPCHNAKYNQGKSVNKPDQSTQIIFQNQGPDYRAEAKRRWSRATTPSQIERYLKIIDQTFF